MQEMKTKSKLCNGWKMKKKDSFLVDFIRAAFYPMAFGQIQLSKRIIEATEITWKIKLVLVLKINKV